MTFAIHKQLKLYDSQFTKKLLSPHIVTCMRYIGHTLNNDINDSLVKAVINDFSL